MARLAVVAAIWSLLSLTVTTTMSKDYEYGAKFHYLKDKLEELIYKNRETQVRLVIDHIRFMESLTPEQELMLHMPDKQLEDEWSEEENEDKGLDNQGPPFSEPVLE